MNYLIFALLCGLPFAHFLFRNIVDIWTAQGIWFQAGVFILFALSFFKKPINDFKPNIPLSLLTLWIGILTGYIWISFFLKGVLPTIILFPFINFLTFLLFYKIIVSYLTRSDLDKLLFYLSRMMFVVLAYCLLQLLHLDQFYHHLEQYNTKDQLVGTIGNAHHLSNYLGICLPLFFLKRSKLNSLAILIIFGLIAKTGSVSGLVVAVAVTIFFSFYRKPFGLKTLLGIIIFGIIFFFLKFRTDFFILIKTYFNPHGRVDFWKYLYTVFAKKPILGNGLGVVNAIALNEPFKHWRHAHNEYLHFLVEIGVIGFAGVAYCIIDWFKRFSKITKSRLMITSASIFVGFLISCLFSYPAHLWLPASMGAIGYCSLFILEE